MDIIDNLNYHLNNETSNSLGNYMSVSSSNIEQKLNRFLDNDPLHQRSTFIFLAWCIFANFDSWFLGQWSFIRIGDVADFLIPIAINQSKTFNLLNIPINYDSILSGINGQKLLNSYRVDNYLYTFLPPWLAYSFFKSVQVLIASLFSYKLFKEIFNSPVVIAILLSLLYSIFVPMELTRLGMRAAYGFAYAGLPLLLYVILFKGYSPFKKNIYLLISGILISATSFLVHTWVTIGTIFIFLFVHSIHTKDLKNNLCSFLSLSFGWLLYSLPIIYFLKSSSVVQNSRSLRPPFELSVVFNKTLSSPLYLALFYSPLVLMIVYIAIKKNKNKASKYLDQNYEIFKKTLMLFLFVKIFTTFFQYFSQGRFSLLGMESFSFRRIGYGFHIILYIYFALLFNSFLKTHKDEITIKVVKTFALILISWLSFEFISHKYQNIKLLKKGSTFTEIFKHPLIKKLSKTSAKKNSFRVATLTSNDTGSPTNHHPMYNISYDLQEAGGYYPMYTLRYHNFWMEMTRNNKTKHMKKFKEGGGRVYLWYGLRGKYSKLGEIVDENLLSYLNVKYLISPMEISGSFFRPYLNNEDQINSFNQKYQTRTSKILGKLLGEFPGKKLFIYKNRNFIPRLFLSTKLRLFNDSSTLLKSLRNLQFDKSNPTIFANSRDIPQKIQTLIASSNQNLGRSVIKEQEYSVGQHQNTISVKNDRPVVLSYLRNYSTDLKFSIVNKSGDKQILDTFPIFHTLTGVLIPKPGKWTIEIK